MVKVAMQAGCSLWRKRLPIVTCRQGDRWERKGDRETVGGTITSRQLGRSTGRPLLLHILHPESFVAEFPQAVVGRLADGRVVLFEGVQFHPEFRAHGQHRQSHAHDGHKEGQLDLPLLLVGQSLAPLAACPGARSHTLLLILKEEIRPHHSLVLCLSSPRVSILLEK